MSKMENGQLHNAKNFTSPRKNRFQKFRFKGWNFLCDVNAFFYHQEKVFLQYVRVRHWFSTGVPWKALWVPSISDLISIYNSICCKLLLEVPPNCSITKESCSKFKKTINFYWTNKFSKRLKKTNGYLKQTLKNKVSF